jgi:hypothetical protein
LNDFKGQNIQREAVVKAAELGSPQALKLLAKTNVN